MGQKTNVLTLRKNKLENLNLNSESTKFFLYGFFFIKHFEKLLLRKGIILASKILNYENGQFFLNITTFFRSTKMISYKRKKLIYNKPLVSIVKSSIFSNFIKNQFGFFNTNLVILNCKNLNKSLNKFIVVYFYEQIRRFNSILFARRFNLFIDFIKFTSFFVESKITSDCYLYLLGQIFRILPKRKHSRFLFFLKNLFKTIIELNTRTKIVSSIKGIKFIINGKLQGKTRASSSSIQVGSVPIQSLEKNVDFSRLHVYTLYGAFGFQMWVYRK